MNASAEGKEQETIPLNQYSEIARSRYSSFETSSAYFIYESPAALTKQVSAALDSEDDLIDSWPCPQHSDRFAPVERSYFDALNLPQVFSRT